MCLSASSLLLFLALLPQDSFEIGRDRIVINAEVRPAIWEARGEDWGTDAKNIDATLRMSAAQSS